jgi:microcystin-dependent protein
MGTPFLGELRLMSFNFPPKGWAFADGQMLPIAQNQALFSLFGTMYGGNGQTYFQLPDLRGRTPIHRSVTWTQGRPGGEEFHTLTVNELPAHSHPLVVSTRAGDTPLPAGHVLASLDNGYRAAGDLTTLNAATVTPRGSGQPHENRPPSLALNWCVSLSGAFPSQN